MKLEKDKSYTNSTSDLAITIVRIAYEFPTYYKVSAKLFNKRNRLLYEIKNYKLYKELIASWQEVKHGPSKVTYVLNRNGDKV